MGNHGLVLHQREGTERGAHALPLRVSAGAVQHKAVGGQRGLQGGGLDRFAGVSVVHVQPGLAGDFAGNLAGFVAAHAVAHDEHGAPARGVGVGVGEIELGLVLVVLAHPAHVGFLRDLDLQAHPQLSGGRNRLDGVIGSDIFHHAPR